MTCWALGGARQLAGLAACSERRFLHAQLAALPAGLRWDMPFPTPHRFLPWPASVRRLAQETHEVARRKQEQMERLRGAFGFAEEASEGWA